eukprot:TRINITY_DN31607_c0_g1_i2.p1 TRINITY_DN31607_c0_g1~~TRINITY_DN31607_c0_g1_i2.p1  ORF type:complete len:141 (-),score=3.57 TRINITY_DN31607_c0_g1_i2:45-467(-)
MDLLSPRVEALPPLKQRSPGYYTQPVRGCFVFVLIASALLGIAAGSCWPGHWLKRDESLLRLMWCWVGVAAICWCWIIVARAGELTRSKDVCYPMPAVVAERLREGQSLDEMANLSLGDSSYDTGWAQVRPYEVSPVIPC